MVVCDDIDSVEGSVGRGEGHAGAIERPVLSGVRMSIGEGFRAAMPRPDTANTRRANMLADINMGRLTRRMSRCECGHGIKVHTETGCEMNDCGCDHYVE